MLSRFPLRKITRDEAKRILGLCFKINRGYKTRVFKELEEYGLLIFVNKHEFFINHHEIENDIK